jgi:hypothetical protein
VIPHYFNKFKYKAKNDIQEILIQKYLPLQIKKSKEDYEVQLLTEHNIDEYIYNYQEKSAYLPQFTMNFSFDPNEKIVVEVTTASMNMCELLQLINTLSSAPSCLINLFYFSMDIDHPCVPMSCSLEELYINNTNFTILRKDQEYDFEIIMGRFIKATKLFLQQMACVEYRDNFELYFEDKEMYFLVWSIILRISWENQEITDKVNQFSKYICRTFNVCMFETQLFRHKINLFTFEEMKRLVEIQKKTSFFLKSTKLVIWN